MQNLLRIQFQIIKKNYLRGRRKPYWKNQIERERKRQGPHSPKNHLDQFKMPLSITTKRNQINC